MEEVEQHPLFDPRVKLTATQQPPTPPQGEPSSKSCDSQDEGDSGPSLCALFDAAESEKEAKPPANSKKKEGIYHGFSVFFVTSVKKMVLQLQNEKSYWIIKVP